MVWFATEVTVGVSLTAVTVIRIAAEALLLLSGSVAVIVMVTFVATVAFGAGVIESTLEPAAAPEFVFAVITRPEARTAFVSPDEAVTFSDPAGVVVPEVRTI